MTFDQFSCHIQNKTWKKKSIHSLARTFSSPKKIYTFQVRILLFQDAIRVNFKIRLLNLIWSEVISVLCWIFQDKSILCTEINAFRLGFDPLLRHLRFHLHRNIDFWSQFIWKPNKKEIITLLIAEFWSFIWKLWEFEFDVTELGQLLDFLSQPVSEFLHFHLFYVLLDTKAADNPIRNWTMHLIRLKSLSTTVFSQRGLWSNTHSGKNFVILSTNLLIMT